jgi:hypothetical protein
MHDALWGSQNCQLALMVEAEAVDRTPNGSFQCCDCVEMVLSQRQRNEAPEGSESHEKSNVFPKFIRNTGNAGTCRDADSIASG